MDKTIKERLAILETKIDVLNGHFENHLSDHKQLFYIWVGVVAAVVVNIALQIIRI